MKTLLYLEWYEFFGSRMERLFVAPFFITTIKYLFIIINLKSSNIQVYEWQGWWDKRKEILDRSKDPNRLFNRRGNNLLKEQKEEKEVKRNLPKIEKELRQMVQEYDNLHGKYYEFSHNHTSISC